MKNNEYNRPSAIAVVVAQEPKFEYYFKVKRRSFFCYKNYIVVERGDDIYNIKTINNNNILSFSKHKSVDNIVDIMKTVGIKNNNIYRVSVCNGQATMSTKRFYNLKGVINFIYTTDQLLNDVNYS